MSFYAWYNCTIWPLQRCDCCGEMTVSGGSTELVHIVQKMFSLTHCSLETPQRLTGKQLWLRSDAAESPLFANKSTIFLYKYLNHIAWHPQIKSRIFQFIVWGSSFSLQWVKTTTLSTYEKFPVRLTENLNDLVGWTIRIIWMTA